VRITCCVGVWAGTWNGIDAEDENYNACCIAWYNNDADDDDDDCLKGKGGTMQ